MVTIVDAMRGVGVLQQADTVLQQADTTRHGTKEEEQQKLPEQTERLLGAAGWMLDCVKNLVSESREGSLSGLLSEIEHIGEAYEELLGATRQVKLDKKCGLNWYRDLAFQGAKKNGWYEGAVNIPERIASLHGELSEALREYESIQEYGESEGSQGPAVALSMPQYKSNGVGPLAPCGFAVEMTDVLIEALGLCGYLRIDVERIFREKLKYNSTRGKLHRGSPS